MCSLWHSFRRHAVLLVLCACAAYGQAAAQAPATVPGQAAAVQSPADLSSYKLAADDKITVMVVGHPELNSDYIVAEDGKINIAGTGEMQAAGLTLSQLTEKIRTLYSTNRLVGLLHPVVSVSLHTARMQRIYVIGDVRSPGIFEFKPGWRITEALAAAGGTLVNIQPMGVATGERLQPKDVSITIIHPQANSTEEFRLDEVLTGTLAKDPLLHMGDVVSVRTKDLVTVYVTGNVGKPGAYQMSKENPDVMKAITMAGGVNTTASTAHISVTHSTGTTEIYDLSNAFQHGLTENLPKIGNGDLILVPELQSKIAVLGLVNGPGTFALPDGKEVRLNDALGMAQGYNTKRARLSQVAIVRYNNGKPTKTIYDVGKYFRTGDLAMNPLLHAGDLVYVPETNSPDWNQIFGGIMATAATLSGARGYIP